VRSRLGGKRINLERVTRITGPRHHQTTTTRSREKREERREKREERREKREERRERR